VVRTQRLTPLVAALLAAGLGVAGLGVAGCGPAAAPTRPPAEATAPAPGPARQGREAPGARVAFAPARLLLPDGTRAPVDVVATRDGVLDVPRSVDRVGWWDGSAQVGDPFGATVLAGHVDSREQGLGVLARLLDAVVGDVVVVEGAAGAASYRVVSVEEVPKAALSTTSTALDQTGAHRLVLITCTGRFDPVRRSYDDNLVVTAVPVDPPG
jgi:LPXTG-site transpeptidase (sortase) family protein